MTKTVGETESYKGPVGVAWITSRRRREIEVLTMNRSVAKSPAWAAVWAGVLAFVCGVVCVGGLAMAQAPQTAQGQTAQAEPTPQWEIDAGGKMAFDVASVKQNTSGPTGPRPTSNVPLDPLDLYVPTGGLFSAVNYPLFAYALFAYKLNTQQAQELNSQLPKWATAGRFDIEARSAGNPTKDQMRLMIQAVLADRFHMAIHFEKRQMPIFGLVLDRPGKTGPQLVPHTESPPCSAAGVPLSVNQMASATPNGFPEACGGFVPLPSGTRGVLRMGARNVSIAAMAMAASVPMAGIDRPVVDDTGLKGTFDMIIEFAPQMGGPSAPGATPTEEPGPTFLEALKEQLGLKLVPSTGPVDVLVVDHIEEPTPN